MIKIDGKYKTVFCDYPDCNNKQRVTDTTTGDLKLVGSGWEFVKSSGKMYCPECRQIKALEKKRMEMGIDPDPEPPGDKIKMGIRIIDLRIRFANKFYSNGFFINPLENKLMKLNPFLDAFNEFIIEFLGSMGYDKSQPIKQIDISLDGPIEWIKLPPGREWILDPNENPDLGVDMGSGPDINVETVVGSPEDPQGNPGNRETQATGPGPDPDIKHYLFED